MTDPSLDLAPADILRFAFTPPTHIREHEELGPLYNEIVARMRNEAAGLPLETNQNLLLSRIALGAVEMMYRDENGWGPGTNAQKDYYAQWLATMREWNTVLKDNREKVTEKIIEDLSGVVLGALENIENDDDRRRATLYIKEKFAQRGY